MGKIFIIASVCWFNSYGQPAPTIRLSDLQEMMAEKTIPIHVINFWATWCGPCVKELPLFEKITAEGRPDIKITLISLDLDLDPDPEKVYQFLKRKNIQSEAFLLEEADPNSWISKVEEQWSGALPATIIINHNTGKRTFIGRALREGELEKYIEGSQKK